MPLLWGSCAFLCGLLLEIRLDIGWQAWLIMAGVFLLLSLFDRPLTRRFLFWSRLHSRLPFSLGILLLFFSLGGLRFWAAGHPLWQVDDLAWYNDKGEYLLTGWVSAAPDRREGMTVYQISAIEIEDSADPDWAHAARRVSGLAQVRMSADSGWQYGDLLQFNARLVTPSSSADFSYRDYLAQERVYSVVYHPQGVKRVGTGYGNAFRRGLIDLREKARASIFAVFPQPEAGLLEGILLGVDNDLPESLAQAYRDTGTAHVIAISGFNMSVLAGLFLFLFVRAGGPYWAALISAVLLLTYTLFVDASPSVLRALIMAVMAAGGHLIGRRQSGMNALFFTAAAICLFNPLLIRDAGFQLSFAATFGLVAFAQPLQDGLQNWLEGHLSERAALKLTKPVSEYFLFTLAAQAATLPVIALHFGRVSLSSLLANPLVLPAQPPILVLGGVTTLAGMLSPLAGKVLMLFTWPFVRYSNWMVALLARIKGGVLILHPAFAGGFLAVFLCFLLLFFTRKKLMKFFRSATFAWIVFALICACVTVFSIYLHKPDGLLHLRLVRCGEQGSLIVQTPGGQNWLIDPQGSVDELTTKLEGDLSPWNFHLDAVLLTSRHASGTLEQLAGDIAINRVLLAPSSYRPEFDAANLSLPEGIETEKLLPADTVEVEPGVFITLLAESEDGTALLLQYGALRVLIPNSVDYAEIKATAPEAMSGLSALVLDERDTSYIPPRVWRQLEPQGILWKDVSLSPFEESVGLDTHPQLELTSDGVGIPRLYAE